MAYVRLRSFAALTHFSFPSLPFPYETTMTKIATKPSNSLSSSSINDRRAQLLNSLSSYHDEYEDVISLLPERKQKALTNKLASLNFSAAATAPIVCLGPDKCPFFNQCPIGDGITKEKKPIYNKDAAFPIGKHCILERAYLEERLAFYIDEFNINPAELAEVSLINDLLVIDVQKNRALFVMSLGDRFDNGRDMTLLTETFSDKGMADPLTSLITEHPLLSRIDALDKKRINILEQLNATRKAKLAVAKVISEEKTANAMLDQMAAVKNIISEKLKENKTRASSAASASTTRASDNEPFIDAEIIEIDE